MSASVEKYHARMAEWERRAAENKERAAAPRTPSVVRAKRRARRQAKFLIERPSTRPEQPWLRDESGAVSKRAARRLTTGRFHGVPSYVYFIRVGDTGPVKIGRSADPYTRLSDLQVGNPLLLRLLDVMPGGEPEEMALHGQLERYRIGGEWFHPDPEALRLIDAAFVRVLDSDFEIENSGLARFARIGSP